MSKLHKSCFNAKKQTMINFFSRMIGEFDYDSLFFSDTPDDIPYRTLTLSFFLGFMLIVPIVIMNLLVSWERVNL